MTKGYFLISILFSCGCAIAFGQQAVVPDSSTVSQVLSLVHNNEYEKAHQVLDRMDALQRTNPSRDYVNLLIDVGDAFDQKGDYGSAQRYFFSALDMAAREGYEDLEAHALIGIGYCNYFLNHLEKGIEYVERALTIAKRLKMESAEGTAYNLLGILHVKLKADHNLVLEYYHQALAIRTRLHDARGVAATLSNIAILKERDGELEEALSLQLQSLEIEDSITNHHGIAWSYQLIGNLLVTMGRTEEADQYLTMAEQKASALQAREITLQTFKSRSRLLTLQQNYKEALEYSNRYNALRDSIYHAELISRVSSFQQSYETRERDRQIARQQAALTWQKWLVVGGLITGAVIIALLFFYYKAYKKSSLLNLEITARNKEVQEQAEELKRSNKTIQLLNERLNSDIELKKEELFRTNQELVQHNNELLQFSFTVSHNLRGPVARMMGLMNLIRMNVPQQEREYLIQLLQESTLELDVVLKDLNLIIDSRNAISRIREKVYFEDEWRKSLTLLGEYARNGYGIHADFSAMPYVYSVRAMIQNVIYNLLSNAIKYRSPERNLSVNVYTYEESGKVYISISDNGLGIDMSRHKQDIFKLYKRFHPHLTGKGLGLYLVKTQVESLGGTISVESELNKGATFLVSLPVIQKAEEQILLETDGVKLYYDANINNTVIIWKRPVSGVEYRQAFETVMQTLHTYNTPGWIADLRNQGQIPEAERSWFMGNVLRQAVEHGLKRIAAIGFRDPIRADYYASMSERVNQLGIKLNVFDDMDEAKQWMEGFVVGTTPTVSVSDKGSV